MNPKVKQILINLVAICFCLLGIYLGSAYRNAVIPINPTTGT